MSSGTPTPSVAENLSRPVLGTFIYLWGGSPFLVGARTEIRDRAPGMMLLIAMAITVAWTASMATSLGWFDLEFWWELAALVTIMLLGHWQEMKAIGQAHGALAALAELLPTDAEREKGGGLESVAIDELQPNDVVLVRPGGRIILIVPAFMFAMSQVDIATGHIRRYTKKSMRAAMSEAGLEIEKLHYANALGLIGYYGATSIFKLAPKEGPMVKVYDSLVLPATKFAEQIVKPPFGQSVFVVARTAA